MPGLGQFYQCSLRGLCDGFFRSQKGFIQICKEYFLFHIIFSLLLFYLAW